MNINQFDITKLDLTKFVPVDSYKLQYTKNNGDRITLHEGHISNIEEWPHTNFGGFQNLIMMSFNKDGQLHGWQIMFNTEQSTDQKPYIWYKYITHFTNGLRDAKIKISMDNSTVPWEYSKPRADGFYSLKKHNGAIYQLNAEGKFHGKFKDPSNHTYGEYKNSELVLKITKDKTDKIIQEKIVVKDNGEKSEYEFLDGKLRLIKEGDKTYYKQPPFALKRIDDYQKDIHIDYHNILPSGEHIKTIYANGSEKEFYPSGNMKRCETRGIDYDLIEYYDDTKGLKPCKIEKRNAKGIIVEINGEKLNTKQLQDAFNHWEQLTKGLNNVIKYKQAEKTQSQKQ